MHQFTAWCKTRVCQPRFIQTLHWYFVIPSPPKYSILKSFVPKKRLWETKINMLWSFIIRLRKHLKTLFLKHFVRSECGTAYWRWGRASKRGTGDRELDLRQIGWDTFRAFPNLILHSNLPLHCNAMHWNARLTFFTNRKRPSRCYHCKDIFKAVFRLIIEQSFNSFVMISQMAQFGLGMLQQHKQRVGTNKT